MAKNDKPTPSLSEIEDVFGGVDAENEQQETTESPDETETDESEQARELRRLKSLELENEKLKAKLYSLERENVVVGKKLEYAQAEKRKPGITQLDDDGATLKKKRVNTTGLSDQMLPPYTQNTIAIYRILTSDGINPATNLPVDPVDTCIPGRYKIYDPFEKDVYRRDKYMKNVTGTTQVIKNGSPVTEDVVEDIIFHRGFIQVPVKEKYAMYVFLERHPFNRDNKYRPNNAAVVFERIDTKQKSPMANSMMLDLALDAGNMARTMSKDDMFASCTAANPPINTMGRRVDDVRADFIRYAMSNPVAFFKIQQDTAAAVKITVSEAINLGLIEYRPGDKSFILSETEEVIYTHTPQEIPMEGLVKFLAKEKGGEWYKAIKQSMNYWD